MLSPYCVRTLPEAEERRDPLEGRWGQGGPGRRDPADPLPGRTARRPPVWAGREGGG